LSNDGLDSTTIKNNDNNVDDDEGGPKTGKTAPKQTGIGTAASKLLFTLYPLLSTGWVKKLAAITMYCGEGVAVEMNQQQSKKE
jgi:hypothetical protein